MINITVVTYNRLPLTKICLHSLYQLTEEKYALHIVDNGSSDGTQDFLREFSKDKTNVTVHFLRHNMGVAVAANLGWAAMDADYYMKLDNDIQIISSQWLQVLRRTLEENSEVALAGHRCADWHESKNVVLRNGEVFHSAIACNGGCILIPRRTHEKLGFWNEDYGKYGFEDLEYGNRALLTKALIGYHPEGGMIKHLGQAGTSATYKSYDDFKISCYTSQDTGEKLYIINKFLFENNLRPLYVNRRYLPSPCRQGVKFLFNPEYKIIVRLHKTVWQKIEYTVVGQKVALSLRDVKDFQ